MPTLNTKEPYFTNNLFDVNDARPDLLLQYLIQLQRHYSYIPQQEITNLADKSGIPPVRIYGVIDFYSFLHTSPRGHFDILFSDSITDHMSGSRKLLDLLCTKLNVENGQPRDDGRVTIATTSCTGMCDQGPALLVNGRAVTRLDQERIKQIAKFVEQDIPLEQWPDDFFHVENNIHRSDILLQQELEQGAALRILVDQGQQTMLQQLDDSGLRGRGGAGFNTAKKWSFCRDAASEQRFVVCNADEGEPGTFKDRVLLQTRADAVIEGMTLCAGIIGANKGFIYLRGEYFFLQDHLQAVLQQRREANLLGTNILGKDGWAFDIEIHLGAGAYICGEESALIESLEGKRGIPRNRPPFPVTDGYKNQPTVVNNVETFFAATAITLNGSTWFRSRGTKESAGTKLLSISGDCRYPGIYEYGFGVSVAQILADCGAADTQAVQVAGAAGEILPANQFDRHICFEDASTGGSFMVFNQQRDLLGMVQNFTHFFVHESCGFCTPCRVGSSLLKDLVDKVCAGHATQYDLEEIRAIAAVMQTASHCGLGHSAPNPVVSSMDHLPDIYQRRLKSTNYEPAFDLDAALVDSKKMAGQDNAG